jgi:hypothetical protein
MFFRVLYYSALGRGSSHYTPSLNVEDVRHSMDHDAIEFASINLMASYECQQKEAASKGSGKD